MSTTIDTQNIQNDERKTVLVVGSNRGIGLQLLKTFQKRGWEAHGSIRPSSRNDPSVKDLAATGAHILFIDYNDESSIIEAARAFGDRPLDCLVNCGGYGVKPDDSWSYSYDDILDRLKTMVVGPFIVTKHFKPNLEKSEAGRVLNISSEMGSIARNDDEGENIGYRIAKAALNQQTKTLAQELAKAGSKIRLVAVCPGSIPTRMTKWKGYVDIVESCDSVVDVVLNLSAEESGSFKNRKGETLPW